MAKVSSTSITDNTKKTNNWAPEKQRVNNEVSYRKQLARQHSCHKKILATVTGMIEGVKHFRIVLFDRHAKIRCSVSCVL